MCPVYFICYVLCQHRHTCTYSYAISGVPAVGAAVVRRPAEVRAPDQSVIFGRWWVIKKFSDLTFSVIGAKTILHPEGSGLTTLIK